MNYHNFTLRITHIPTGITGEFSHCGATYSQLIARKKALSVLKARIWAHYNLQKSNKVFTYILEDDYCPDDLMKCRKRVSVNEQNQASP
jgi:hypothetical protein